MKKLVLVLDLDNTLIHTKEANGELLMRQRARNYIKYENKLTKLFDVFSRPWRYFVKVRPFFTDFMLQILPKFRVFFYTAGIHQYGLAILDVLKQSLDDDIAELDVPENEKNKFYGLVNSTFKEARLIGRDDQHRFETEPIP